MLKSEYESDSDSGQLDLNLLLNTESDKWIMRFFTADTFSYYSAKADFPVKLQGYKTNSLFNTCAQVSCIAIAATKSSVQN